MRKAITHLRRSDPVLGRIIDSVGPYSIEYRDPCFDTLVRSIVFQQLSGAVATVIFNRLKNAMPEGEVTPANILKMRKDRMRKLGLSTAKTEYIRDLARHANQGIVQFETLTGLPDDHVIETLTQVKGIGVWTAQMFLMFALQRHNVLPLGDLGVRKAIQLAYQLPELPKPGIMQAIAKPWHPYCSVASWYLWRSLDGPAAL